MNDINRFIRACTFLDGQYQRYNTSKGESRLNSNYNPYYDFFNSKLRDAIGWTEKELDNVKKIFNVEVYNTIYLKYVKRLGSINISHEKGTVSRRRDIVCEAINYFKENYYPFNRVTVGGSAKDEADINEAIKLIKLSKTYPERIKKIDKNLELARLDQITFNTGSLIKVNSNSSHTSKGICTKGIDIVDDYEAEMEYRRRYMYKVMEIIDRMDLTIKPHFISVYLMKHGGFQNEARYLGVSRNTVAKELKDELKRVVTASDINELNQLNKLIKDKMRGTYRYEKNI